MLHSMLREIWMKQGSIDKPKRYHDRAFYKGSKPPQVEILQILQNEMFFTLQHKLSIPSRKKKPEFSGFKTKIIWLEPLYCALVKYGFCKKSLRKNETLTSWTLLALFFSRSALIWKNPYSNKSSLTNKWMSFSCSNSVSSVVEF